MMHKLLNTLTDDELVVMDQRLAIRYLFNLCKEHATCTRKHFSSNFITYEFSLEDKNYWFCLDSKDEIVAHRVEKQLQYVFK